ncbi:MAG: ABC transporter permease [Candidatus Cloacimonetes bacterium]|nr:ABC transporter permease [Candidatus Cloacimonadota bacterium]
MFIQGSTRYTLMRYGELLRVLLVREAAARTSGTTLGAIWMLVQPALQVAAFWFLLQVVLRVRYPDLPGGFTQYFLIGMLPWLMLNEILIRSLSVLQEYSSIYERTTLPIGLIPLLPPIVSGAIYTLIYFVVAALLSGIQGALGALGFMVFLIFWLAPLVYLMAILGLFIRDLAQIAPFALTMMLYLTPIFYTPTALPDYLHWWLNVNPFAQLMIVAHACADGSSLPLASFLSLILLWFVLAVPAWFLFKRAAPYVREAL